MDRGSHHYPDTTTTSSYSEDEDRPSSMNDRTMTTNVGGGRVLSNERSSYPNHAHNEGSGEEDEEEENGSSAVPKEESKSATTAGTSTAKPTPIPWGAMYKQLKEYYNEHGHTKVKLIRGKNDRFVTWVRNQKTILGKAKREKAPLTATMAERISKLDVINFDWPKPIASSSTVTTKPASFSSANKNKEPSVTATTAVSKQNKAPESKKHEPVAKASRSSPKTVKIQKALPFKKRNATSREQETPIADSSSFSTADTSGDEVSLHEEDAVVFPPSSVPPPKKKDATPEEKEAATTWDAFYELLRSFYNKHGHTKVKLLKGENDKFVNWIRNQKTFLGKVRRRPKPLPDTDIKAIRIAKLDALEFDWPKPIGGGGDAHSVGEHIMATTPPPLQVSEPKHSTVSDEGSSVPKKNATKKRTSGQEVEPKKVTSSQEVEPKKATSSQEAEPKNATSSQEVEPPPAKKARSTSSGDAAILETVGLDEQNAAKALLCLIGAW